MINADPDWTGGIDDGIAVLFIELSSEEIGRLEEPYQPHSLTPLAHRNLVPEEAGADERKIRHRGGRDEEDSGLDRTSLVTGVTKFPDAGSVM
jgi:hypothetical protein